MQLMTTHHSSLITHQSQTRTQSRIPFQDSRHTRRSFLSHSHSHFIGLTYCTSFLMIDNSDPKIRPSQHRHVTRPRFPSFRLPCLSYGILPFPHVSQPFHIQPLRRVQAAISVRSAIPVSKCHPSRIAISAETVTETEDSLASGTTQQLAELCSADHATHSAGSQKYRFCPASLAYPAQSRPRHITDKHSITLFRGVKVPFSPYC
jgi:hypothetical protein